MISVNPQAVKSNTRYVQNGREKCVTDRIRHRIRAALLAAAVCGAAPVLAHHSFQAEFDIGKPMTLQGVVTKVEWINPHVYLEEAEGSASTNC